MSKLIDLTGKRFGRLTVIERAENHITKSGKTYVQWLCKCDCGNEVVVAARSLIANLTKSCGCIQKKYNNYDLSGEYGIGYTSKGEEFYFDLEDYELIKPYCWYLSNRGYVTSGCGKNFKLLHRLIMNCAPDMVVDHINHNKLDNRKNNLRVCTQNKNLCNCVISKNNSSGATGVGFDKQRNKWTASITVNYKKIHLGRYDDIEDAIKVRKEAEEKYFGEYSYDNSNNSKNNVVTSQNICNNNTDELDLSWLDNVM